MRQKGQSIIDYVVTFAVIVAALIIMGYYIRNSLSGRMRSAADSIGQGETYTPDQDKSLGK